MSDSSTTGSSGETAVCNQSHSTAQTHTHDGGGRIQHLPHSGTTLRSFITDYYHISRINLSALNSSNGILFTIKDSGRSLMHHHFRSYSGTLYHAGIRSQISLKHRNTADRHKGLINRTNNLLILISGMGNIFLHGLACNGNAGKVQKILLGQLLHHRIHTTGLV